MNRIGAMNRAATSSLLLKNEVSEEENKKKGVKVGHQDLGSSPTFGMSSTATAATTTTSTSMISKDATNYRGSTPATTTTPPPHRGSFNEFFGQSSLGWIGNSLPPSTLCSVMHYVYES